MRFGSGKDFLAAFLSCGVIAMGRILPLTEKIAACRKNFSYMLEYRCKFVTAWRYVKKTRNAAKILVMYLRQ